MSTLREPPSGSLAYRLPYIRELKKLVTDKKVRKLKSGSIVNYTSTVPVYDKLTRKWVVPSATKDTAAASEPEYEEEIVHSETCPSGDAGIEICDILAAVNWVPFLRGGSQILVNHGYGKSVPMLLKFGALSVLRLVKRGRDAFHARINNALRHFGIFKRRKTQLLKGIRHVLRTGSAGLLTRAIYDARFVPSLSRGKLFALAEQLLAKHRGLLKKPSSTSMSDSEVSDFDDSFCTFVHG